MIAKTHIWRAAAITISALLAMPAAATPAKADIDDLTTRYIELRLANDPTLAYGLTHLKGDDAALPDHREAAIRRLDASEDAISRKLVAIDTGQLSPRAHLSYDLLKQALGDRRAMRACKLELWNVNQYRGWQSRLIEAAEQQPVGTAGQRAKALMRWSSLPTFAENERENLDTGLAAGLSAPRSVVSRVIKQIDGLLDVAPEQSPFYAPANRSEDPQFKAAMRATIIDSVNPALRGYRNYLASTYLPKAREDVAMSALPNGRQCYAAMLRASTSLNRTPRQIYDEGLALVKANEAFVVARGQLLYGSADFATIVRRNSAAPGNSFDSPDDLLTFARSTLDRSLKKVRSAFDAWPQQPVIIERLPDFQYRSGISPHYVGSKDQSRPGKFVIPLQDWRTLRRGLVEVMTVHEAVPGHHLQNALAFASERISPVAEMMDTSAYGEGWARYAENLAEELGVYRSDVAKITRRGWAARGMVVDPGIHTFGWSRERAISYIMESGIFDRPAAEIMVDRIASMPGQLTAYDTGGHEILALRAEAQAKLGSRFDLAKFHDQILLNGPLPLEVLDQEVRRWIRAQMAESDARKTG